MAAIVVNPMATAGPPFGSQLGARGRCILALLKLRRRCFSFLLSSKHAIPTKVSARRWFVAATSISLRRRQDPADCDEVGQETKNNPVSQFWPSDLWPTKIWKSNVKIFRLDDQCLNGVRNLINIQRLHVQFGGRLHWFKLWIGNARFPLLMTVVLRWDKTMAFLFFHRKKTVLILHNWVETFRN